MTNEKFQFERELPISTIAEIKRLQEDGYVIHKEWLEQHGVST
jgi:hypothetical protein